jgi:light-regulated signal transduction histidine kinase (bacteriophytochrome)
MNINTASPIAGNKQSELQCSLEKIRDELEVIGYVASHDLQAPLRVIQSCSEELCLHPDFAASEAYRNNVHMLTTEAARMKRLIQGMLDYVRLETFIPAQVILDSNEIVAAAIAMQAEEIKAAGANITCDVLPQIVGHRGRLVRLFTHLIDNALKFHGSKPADIHIAASRCGDSWEFCVSDNGIGVSVEHHRIIFSLFQRLHTAKAYPGDGIGLALARKIVEAHGGAIRVESAASQGSRFYFTLHAARTQ